MGKTIISWATHTVNPVHGCSKPAAVPDNEYTRGLVVDSRWRKSGSSAECAHCYAEALSNRRGWTPAPWLEANEDVNITPHLERIKEFARVPVKPVSLPPSQRERFFVCSMADIFHRAVPDEFLHRIFAAMIASPHIYQVLTKRPERAANWPGPWPENIWLGTSCGHEVTKWRIDALRDSGARTRFVSMEPLLTPMLPLDLRGIGQVIVGGESGPGYRPMRMEWARDVRDTCADQGVAFFYKQDAAFRTETRCYLVEPDGSCWQWRQFPGELTPPLRVEPDSSRYHEEKFAILA